MDNFPNLKLAWINRAISAFHPSGSVSWVVTHIKTWVTEQTAEGLARGAAYHVCQRLLLVASLQCNLVQGQGTEMSAPSNAAGCEPVRELELTKYACRQCTWYEVQMLLLWK